MIADNNGVASDGSKSRVATLERLAVAAVRDARGTDNNVATNWL